MSEPPESRRLQGVAASGGVGIGCALVVGLQPPVACRHIAPAARAEEVERLRLGIAASESEIEGVRDRLMSLHGEKHALILDAHLLMHRDEIFVGAARGLIESEGANAERALERVASELSADLEASGIPYLQERGRDVHHVSQHIIRALAGPQPTSPEISGPTILVARDLSPADAFRLMSEDVQGLVTALGSPASHTALLARTMGIAAVVAVPHLLEAIASGGAVILDGFTGELLLGPDAGELDRAESRRERHMAFRRELASRPKGPTTTVDGTSVAVFANLEMAAEASLAAESDVAGVGLYRTEFLFLNREGAPDEEAQVRVYGEVVRVMAPQPVVFRTMDIGGDKVAGGGLRAEPPNPLLGLRGVRLSLARGEALFRPQLRALLRASVEGPTQIMFPLVADVTEYRRARAWVERCARELAEEGVAIGEVEIGAMVEVPSAALGARALADEADFLSLGTNDLTQYALAADRANPAVVGYASSLHPAVLALMAQTVEACADASVPLSICGDMAADPLALPLVIGLGIHRLSVPVGLVPLVREVVRRIDANHATDVAAAALEQTCASAVRALVWTGFAESLGGLWSEFGLKADST